MRNVFFLLVGLVLLFGGPAAAKNISVEVVADQGGILPTYPVSSSSGNYRAYVQAERNARYGVRIRNHTNRRVGLVVTVDGRNIISGKKSHLRNTERMYVLGPYGVADYRGWRTGRDTVNRFYFTEPSDSYAGAWGDQSAMGVIAVAVYAEKPRPVPRISVRPRLYSAPSRARESVGADSAAGTGYGEGEHSSSVQVEFRPEAYAVEKHFYKYEWRETLCRKQIISCAPVYPRQPRNRFWPDDGFAPPPPRYY